MFRSFDNGQNWEQQLNNGLPVKNASAKHLIEFNDRLFAYYSETEGVYATHNLGDSWQSCGIQATIENAEFEFFGMTPLGLTLVYRNHLDYAHKEVFVTTNGLAWFTPNIPAGLNPAVFAGDERQWLSGSEMDYAAISYDKGNNWYNWNEVIHANPNVLGVRPKSLFIVHKTAFAIFGSDLFRRPLTEADTPPIPEPVEIESTGNPQLDALLEEFGASTPEELPAGLLDNFLASNSDASLWDEPFYGGQPGSCNSMGNPLWNVDAVSAQLHITDQIFTTKSLGPNPAIQLAYDRNTSLASRAFGNFWGINYDEEIHISDTTVSIINPESGKRVFSVENPVSGAITLADNLRQGDSLVFDGSRWKYFSSSQRSISTYELITTTVYRLSSIADPEGNTLTINRDGSGNISSIVDAVGRTITLQYTSGKCSGFTLPDGRSATFAYNADGFLRQSSDLASVVSMYTYNAADELATVDVAGKVTQYAYNTVMGFDRIHRVITPVGDTIDFDFEYVGVDESVFTITAGGSTKKYYSKNGQTYKVLGSGGKTSQRIIDDQGRLTGLSSPGGKQKGLEYDSKGHVIAMSDGASQIFDYTWDEAGNLLTKTNALGNTWTYSYDAFNRLTGVLSPEGRSVTIAYHSNGLLKSVTHGGITESYSYDSYGNLSEITNANGGITTYTYDANGYNLLTVKSPEGKTTTYTYDGNHRLTTQTFDDGSATSYGYSCCAQNSKTDANGYTYQFERNANNQIQSIIDPMSNEQSWEYDSKGRTISRTNEQGGLIRYEYNSSNQMSRSIDEAGNATAYFYDGNHKLAMVSDAGGVVTKYARNSRGELTALIHNHTDTVLYQRDALGQITKVRNARRQSITMQYDGDGNATRRIMPEATHTFSWDSQTGLFTGYTDATGTTTYQSDAAGMPEKINFTSDIDIRFSHDLDGNIASYTYADELVVENDFDSRNRIQKISWGDEFIEFTYDAEGNLLTETRSNGSVSSYEYSRVNKLLSIDHRVNGSSVVDYAISRNAVGAITALDLKPAIQPQKGTTTWFDYRYTNDNQLNENSQVQIGTNTYYQYDADGNCTSIIGQIRLKAAYNSVNQLTGLKVASDTLSLQYDAMGYVRSISKSGQIARLYYDQKGRPMIETDGSGTVLRYYIYRGPRLMAFVDRGVSYFMHYDFNGNTVLITDATGQIRNRYYYSAFGEVLARSEQIANRYTFSGAFGVLDLIDGYYLMHARLYQATNGRFLQRDPLNYQGDINAYRYASNDAVNRIDPLGLDDAQETINSTAFDGGYDYNAGVAGGTADAFNPKLKHSANSGTDPVEILGMLYSGITDSPLGDLLPAGLGNAVSIQKAAKKANDGGGLLEIGWQFVPFNNTMEFIYNAKKKELEKRAYDYYHLPDGREKLVDKPFSSCSLW